MTCPTCNHLIITINCVSSVDVRGYRNTYPWFLIKLQSVHTRYAWNFDYSIKSSLDNATRQFVDQRIRYIPGDKPFSCMERTVENKLFHWQKRSRIITVYRVIWELGYLRVRNDQVCSSTRSYPCVDLSYAKNMENMKKM